MLSRDVHVISFVVRLSNRHVKQARKFYRKLFTFLILLLIYWNTVKETAISKKNTDEELYGGNFLILE